MNENFRKIHSETIGVYERQAEEWDKSRSQSSFFERNWIDRFLENLPVGGSVLDAGCGTGEPIAKYIIERGFSVAGIDSSSELLDICRTRQPNENWLFMDMRELKFDQKFDGIVAWDSFFHLDPDEQRKTLVGFIDHINPKGSILLTVGPTAGEALGKVGNEEVYHSSLDFEEYKKILETAGFDKIRFVREDPDCGFHTILSATR